MSGYLTSMLGGSPTRSAASQGGPRGALQLRDVLYPGPYTWFVLLASLDIMMTWIVLFFSGSELNLLARWVLDRWGAPGMVAYKFALVAIVVVICERVGRMRRETGKRLACWVVTISILPVTIASVQLLMAQYS